MFHKEINLSMRLFNNLFFYTQKNKKILNFLAQLDRIRDRQNSNTPRDTDREHLQALDDLLAAIQMGDVDAPIFSNPNCHVYLLHLMYDNKIEFWQGANVYLYLMALMQFTNKQELKETDHEVKLLLPISVLRLNPNELTKEMGEYLFQLCSDLRSFLNISISIADLKEFLSSLPASDQWLIKVPHDETTPNFTTSFLEVFFPNNPLIVTLNGHYYLPSLSLYRFLLHKISPDIEPEIMFGIISEKTLRKSHALGLHPVPLYSPWINRNLLRAHACTCGPIPMIVHDLTHLIGGAITSKYRKEIYELLLPTFDKIYLLAQANEDFELAEKIKKSISILNDWDPSPLKYLAHPEKGFARYIARSLGDHYELDRFYLFDMRGDEPFGTVQDRLFYMLCLFQQANENTRTGDVLKLLINETLSRAQQKEHTTTITDQIQQMIASQEDLYEYLHNTKSPLKSRRSNLDR